MTEHSHPAHPTDPTVDAAAFWEELYAGDAPRWSGRPNATLVSETADLAPGRALDLGSGEGGDAVWLAGRGWTVTGVDISALALDRAAELARRFGVADRIEWVRVDLADWRPTEHYDLVSAQFLHSPVDFPREEVLRRAAAAVGPGGLLLVVGHAEPPPWSHHQPDPRGMPGPEEVLSSLDLPPGEWTVVTASRVHREATGPDGQTGSLVDSVLSVRRQG